MDEFIRNIFTASTLIWLVLSIVITAMLSVATDLAEHPSGFKVGFICMIAFLIGSASGQIPLF
jgi:hypothetical protein